MFTLDASTNENNKDQIKKWPYIPDYPYRMLIIGGSGSGKTNVLLNLTKEQDSDNLIDEIYLNAKELNEPKYQLLIKQREDVGIKHLNDSKEFIEYLACLMFTIISIIITQTKQEKFWLCFMTWLQILWIIANFKP